jgi:hypothetical protein
VKPTGAKEHDAYATRCVHFTSLSAPQTAPRRRAPAVLTESLHGNVGPRPLPSKTFPKVLGRTNSLISLIRYGSYRKRRVQFLYFSVYIRGRGNVFTEPLPSSDRGIHIQTHRLMGGVYEVRR